MKLGTIIMMGIALIMLPGCGTQADRYNSVSTTEAGPVLDPHNSTIAMVGKSVAISWEAVPGAENYAIYRAASRLCDYMLLDEVKETKFTDTAPRKNKFENYYLIAAKSGGETLSEMVISFELQMFGRNTRIYNSKYDSIAKIEEEINLIHDTEMLGNIVDSDGRRAEFSSKRYALYFKPGKYNGYETFRIGFYTHAAGLGKVPSETVLFGSIETPPHLENKNATCTFWRSIENFEIQGYGQFHWAVSQAAPVRRMNVFVPSEFDWGGWSSGGFTGDCVFYEDAGSWSQQQWYARNSHFENGFFGVNWNKVMQGCTGEIDENNWEAGKCSTKEETVPVIREKPFLYFDKGAYKVFVPALRKNSIGPSWTKKNMGPGTSLDLEKDFYIVKEGVDTADSINAALDSGKHIFFTPGRYELDVPIRVKNAGTIVLGTGYATLIPSSLNTYGALFVDDVDNVTIAGLMFDALYDSTYLLSVGEKAASKDHSAAPTLLADLFLRIGGYKEENVNADYAALINSSDVIGDHFWIWRADHGEGIGWDKNTTKNGLIVSGDRVTIYGLFVEHFHEYQTLWLGDKGQMYFYQNETPYDPFNQAVYSSHNGTVDGYSSYKVANSVNEHLAVGLGMYAVFIRTGQDRERSESMFIQNAIEVPNKPGVTVKHACIVEISGEDTEKAQTGVRSVVNSAGPGVGGKFGRETLVSYNNGTAVTPSGTFEGIQPEDEVFTVPENLLP